MYTKFAFKLILGVDRVADGGRVTDEKWNSHKNAHIIQGNIFTIQGKYMEYDFWAGCMCSGYAGQTNQQLLCHVYIIY